jgi:hypothetical protein
MDSENGFDHEGQPLPDAWWWNGADYIQYVWSSARKGMVVHGTKCLYVLRIICKKRVWIKLPNFDGN